MSLFNHHIIKPKKNAYQKKPIKNIKSLDNSSKSTRATSKNILAVQNQKLLEKIDYVDLYSDLINSRQIEKEHSKKKYPKEDYEDSVNDSSFEFEKLIFKKNKKVYSQKKTRINFVKYYKEDGKAVIFPLFKERDIKIDEYDDKVKIESAEDDFESDESTLDYGKKRVKNDLIEAFAHIKKENINCLVNYKRFSRIIKKPKKKLDLRKNLPNIPSVEEKS